MRYPLSLIPSRNSLILATSPSGRGIFVFDNPSKKTSLWNQNNSYRIVCGENRIQNYESNRQVNA